MVCAILLLTIKVEVWKDTKWPPRKLMKMCRTLCSDTVRGNVCTKSDYRQLSTDTLDVLKQFYSEKDARDKQFEDLKAQAEDDFATGPLSMDSFTEDWNASQFWVGRVAIDRS